MTHGWKGLRERNKYAKRTHSLILILRPQKIEKTEKVHNIGKFGYKLNIIFSFIFSLYLKHDLFKTKNMQQGVSKDTINYYIIYEKF